MRTLWLSGIHSAQKEQIIEAIYPASYEIIAAYVTRILAHYPNRDATKDSIIISDLTRLSFDNKVSAQAITEIYDEIIKEGSYGNPFLPPTGVIFRRFTGRTQLYQTLYDQACKKTS